MDPSNKELPDVPAPYASETGPGDKRIVLRLVSILLALDATSGTIV
jgi:hypothetical protein